MESAVKVPSKKITFQKNNMENTSNSIIPISSPYFRCVIDTSDPEFSKWNKISCDIFLENKDIQKRIKSRLFTATEINLYDKIVKLSKKLTSTCKNLKINYHKMLMQSSDALSQGEIIGKQKEDISFLNKTKEPRTGYVLEPLATPEKLWEMLQNDYTPYFCEMAKQSNLMQQYKNYQSKWKNRSTLFESNYAKLLQTLIDSRKTLIGREGIIDEIFSIVITFAYNPYYVINSNLNFAFLSRNGNGKTSMASFLQKMLIYSGILIGDPSSHENSQKLEFVKKEFFLGNSSSETQEKTQKILEGGLEKVIVIEDVHLSSLDKNENLLWTKYGKNVLETFYNFLNQHKGEIAIVMTGEISSIHEKFFGVFQDISKCFPFLFILKNCTVKTMCDILKKELKCVYSIPKSVISSKTFDFLDNFLKQEGQVIYKNSKTGKLSIPHVISYKSLFFPTCSVKDVQILGEHMTKYILSNDLIKKKLFFGKKEMQKVLKIYLSHKKNKKIEGSFLEVGSFIIIVD